MITEEKLQNFLDDLRIGKYDSINYKIECTYNSLKITDINRDVFVSINVIDGWNHDYKVNLFRKERRSIPPRVNIYGEHYSTSVNISDKMLYSLKTYINEQRAKDELIDRANIESAFGL